MAIKTVEKKPAAAEKKQIRKVFFCMIEKNRLVGFIPGTDIEGDPTSTKTKMQEWQLAGSDRQVLEMDGPPASKDMVLENGELREMTNEEKSSIESAANQKETAAWAARRALLASIKQKTGLTDAEMTILLPGYPEWSKPKGGK